MEKKQKLIIGGKRNLNGRRFPIAMLPGLSYLLIFFMVPLMILFRYSFNRNLGIGRMETTFTLENYTNFFSDSFYLKVMADSFEIAIVVCLIVILCSYPVAYYMAKTKSFMQAVVSSQVLLPLLVCAVVTASGWTILLAERGVLNTALMNLGLIDEPLKLMYNKIGIYIAQVHAGIPYMVMSIQNVLVSMNQNAEYAAQTLGADKLNVFLTVTLPLSLPGIAAGTLLVFVDVMSSFIIIVLLGGGKVTTLATLILTQTEKVSNWPFAAAVSLILLVSTTIVLYVYNKVMESRLLGGGGK